MVSWKILNGVLRTALGVTLGLLAVGVAPFNFSTALADTAAVSEETAALFRSYNELDGRFCDLNGDGVVDLDDIMIIFNSLNHRNAAYDLTHDGRVDSRDAYVCIPKCAFPYCAKPAANRAPIITSTPETTTTVGQTYSYQLNAIDPDGSPLAYSLTFAPVGTTISVDGLILWKPEASQAGSVIVNVKVSDGTLSAGQDYVIIVNPLVTNQAPVIISNPATTVRAGNIFTYRINATDPDNDQLLYLLGTAPSGMTVDYSSGEVAWAPSAANTGVHRVVALASDGKLYASQSFDLKVDPPNGTPRIQNISTYSVCSYATVSIPYSCQIMATDPDGDSLSYNLAAGPEGMSINASSGLISWTPSSVDAGSHPVTVQVSDGQGGVATLGYTISVSM